MKKPWQTEPSAPSPGESQPASVEARTEPAQNESTGIIPAPVAPAPPLRPGLVGSIVGYVLQGEQDGPVLIRPAIIVEVLPHGELSLVVFTGGAPRGCFPACPVSADGEAKKPGTWHLLA